MIHRYNDSMKQRQSETEYLESIPGMSKSLISGFTASDSEYSSVVEWEPEATVTQCINKPNK